MFNVGPAVVDASTVRSPTDNSPSSLLPSVPVMRGSTGLTEPPGNGDNGPSGESGNRE